MASTRIPLAEVNSIHLALGAVLILEKNMGAIAGVVVQAIAPVVMNVVASAASQIVGDWLSNALGGAPDAGGGQGICNQMQGHQAGDFRNAAINLVTSMLGDAAKGAVDFLATMSGMPKFLRDAISQAIDQVVQQSQKDCNPATQQSLNACTKKDVANETQNLADQLVDKVHQLLKERLEGDVQEASGAGKAKGKISSKSWLATIAQAMGEVLGQKMEEMTRLSHKITDISGEQKALAEKGKGINSEDKKAMEAHNSDKEALSSEMTQAQTEMTGASQELKFMNEAVSTLLKSVGEALSGMARRQ